MKETRHIQRQKLTATELHKKIQSSSRRSEKVFRGKWNKSTHLYDIRNEHFTWFTNSILVYAFGCLLFVKMKNIYKNWHIKSLLAWGVVKLLHSTTYWYKWAVCLVMPEMQFVVFTRHSLSFQANNNTWANSITKKTSHYLIRLQLKCTSLSLTQTPLQGTVRNQMFMVSERMSVNNQYPYCASIPHVNIL